MSVNKVNQSDGSLAPIAGATIYADMPIGTWIKWDDQTNMPDGFLKYGDTITQADYPELYAMYGATVPYKADKSELGSVNYPYTISTNSAAPTIMPYDGFISFGYLGTSASSPQYLTIWVNGIGAFNTHHANGGQERGMMTIPVKKGDSVYCNNQYDMNTSRWYDKTLIVKAKQTALPTDFGNAVDDKITDTITRKAVTVATSSDGSQLILEKSGNVVCAQFNGIRATDLIAGTIPVGYRPAQNAITSGTLVSHANSTGHVCFVWFNANGAITGAYNNIGSTSQAFSNQSDWKIYGTASWIVP